MATPLASGVLDTVTPSRAWVAVSPLRSWSTIGSTSLIGMAKPRPMEPPSPLSELLLERIEELMPTTSPAMSTSGPPELPGLMAASVWIAG